MGGYKVEQTPVHLLALDGKHQHVHLTGRSSLLRDAMFLFFLLLHVCVYKALHPPRPQITPCPPFHPLPTSTGGEGTEERRAGFPV